MLPRCHPQPRLLQGCSVLPSLSALRSTSKAWAGQEERGTETGGRTRWWCRACSSSRNPCLSPRNSVWLLQWMEHTWVCSASFHTFRPQCYGRDEVMYNNECGGMGLVHSRTSWSLFSLARRLVRFPGCLGSIHSSSSQVAELRKGDDTSLHLLHAGLHSKPSAHIDQSIIPGNP